VVIAWDHRDALLEPFNMIHKGNFPRSPAFTAWRYNVNEIRLMRQCSNPKTSSPRHGLLRLRSQ
jgi:hypothetical protein